MGSSCLLTEGSTRMRKLVLIFLIILGTLMLTKCESRNSLRENVKDDLIADKLLHAEKSSSKNRRESKNRRTGRKKTDKKKQKQKNRKFKTQNNSKRRFAKKNRNQKKLKRRSSKNKNKKNRKRGKQSVVNKKKSSKKKSKESKVAINCARQENEVFCPQQKAISLKLLYNQVTDFKKQLKRAENQAKIVRRKKAKANQFMKDAMIMTDVVGGDLASPSCKSKRSASNAASTGSKLANCSNDISKSCADISINLTLSGSCSTRMDTFTSKVKTCKTDDSCTCWTETAKMKASIAQCNALKEADAVKVKKKSCLSTFSACKKAQDSAVEYTATCPVNSTSITTISPVESTASTTKDTLMTTTTVPASTNMTEKPVPMTFETPVQMTMETPVAMTSEKPINMTFETPVQMNSTVVVTTRSPSRRFQHGQIFMANSFRKL